MTARNRQCCQINYFEGLGTNAQYDDGEQIYMEVGMFWVTAPIA
jgi:hypothetical protein